MWNLKFVFYKNGIWDLDRVFFGLKFGVELWFFEVKFYLW